MQGFSITPGRTPGQGRRLPSSSVLAGRRSAVLATLLLAISTATMWATANTPPDITSATITPSVVNEGQSVTLSGTFTDPDTADAHGLLVYWTGGDENFKEKVELPPGQLSFQLSHKYTDDLTPTSIKVVLFDRQQPIGSNDNIPGLGGHDTEYLPAIQVKNVAPRFVPSSVVGTATASGVVVEGDFTDPGTSDTHQVTGAIGNPIYPPNQIQMTCALSGKGERHFRCEHTHQPNVSARTYEVHLKVRDDDSGQGTHDINVRFNGISRP